MSTHQTDLFTENEAPIPQHMRADVVAQVKSVAQTPVQREFARLLAKIESDAARVETLKTLMSDFGQRFSSTLTPLMAQVEETKRAFVRVLHERLQQPRKRNDLTAKQRKHLADIVCDLALAFAAQGDAEMVAIFDAHHDVPFAEVNSESADMMREMMSAAGIDVPEDDTGDVRTLFEEMQKAMEAELQRTFEREEKRAAKRAERKKNDPKYQAKVAAIEKAERDAKGAIKLIYRQLASVLHPDRAENDTQRIANTSLMSEVNKAYERGDLSALLKLQLKAQQFDPLRLAEVADEKLRSWIAALKEQAKQLACEVHELEQEIRERFGGPLFKTPSERTLMDTLTMQQSKLKKELSDAELLLYSVQDDTGLKQWLKQEIVARRAARRYQDDAMMEDIAEALLTMKAMTRDDSPGTKNMRRRRR